MNYLQYLLFRWKHGQGKSLFPPRVSFILAWSIKTEYMHFPFWSLIRLGLTYSWSGLIFNKMNHASSDTWVDQLKVGRGTVDVESNRQVFSVHSHGNLLCHNFFKSHVGPLRHQIFRYPKGNHLESKGSFNNILPHSTWTGRSTRIAKWIKI